MNELKTNSGIVGFVNLKKKHSEYPYAVVICPICDINQRVRISSVMHYACLKQIMQMVNDDKFFDQSLSQLSKRIGLKEPTLRYICKRYHIHRKRTRNPYLSVKSLINPDSTGGVPQNVGEAARKIAALYHAGKLNKKSLTTLSAEIGVTRQRISSIIKSMGIVKPRVYPKHYKKRIKKTQKNNIIVNGLKQD